MIKLSRLQLIIVITVFIAFLAWFLISESDILKIAIGFFVGITAGYFWDIEDKAT